MEEIRVFNTSDLILKVDKNYNPTTLKINEWESFIDKLCERREYQKEAIRNAIIYLASGKYSSIEDLVIENYKTNSELKKRYKSIEEFKKNLQLKSKLSATIDLATGTGKSYVIYGIAQIMLGLGIVEKVLVLCPSLTIEGGLKKKFEELSGKSILKKVIPQNAKIMNPRIISAGVTIKTGDICIENIHAVYDNSGSSIHDSLKGHGEKTLVINDEAHHIFNVVLNNDMPNIKKWKEFLLNKEYNFKYILGLTGTAYIENEYFNDVIYRYSLRTAISERIIKNIDYIQKDDSVGDTEKFQKIYANHKDNKDKYDKIKPITILITRDIKKAKSLREKLIDFLSEGEGNKREQYEEKVLIVTSSNEHKLNLSKLETIDDKSNTYEWVVSVSMLTEGWDVNNVFQIVPWEDRAFNSKLLIAQVLGRGLRVPKEYNTPQPKVTVFNHDSWSKNIKKLVDEVLEIETRITTQIIKVGERSKYNFSIYNLAYDKVEITKTHDRDKEVYDYSKIKNDGITLVSQIETKEKNTTYESIFGNASFDKTYIIDEKVFTIDEIIEKIYEEFNIRDWEGRILKLEDNEYTKNSLPPMEEVKDIIVKSMERVGIEGRLLVERNRNRILQAFGTLLRKKGKTIITKSSVEDSIKIDTIDMERNSLSVGNFRNGSDWRLFYSTNFRDELDAKDLEVLEKMIEENEGVTAAFNISEANVYLMKTSQNLVSVNGNPEYKFVTLLIKYYELIDSWVKARDTGFYSIEYSWRKGEHQILSSFNPDFFIKLVKDNTEYILVVETKADGDDSDENKAKYKYGIEHFGNLNKKLFDEGIKQQYIFHYISPKDYAEFFEYIKNGKMLLGQFKSELETILEEKE